MKLLLIICALFYSVLCVFSIVTGLIYLSDKKELNPLELSDKLAARLKEENKTARFAKTMGAVTVIVGIVQGLTAYAVFTDQWYALSIGFTVFSLLSAGLKLKSKFHIFPLLKSLAYISILIILIVKLL